MMLGALIKVDACASIPFILLLCLRSVAANKYEKLGFTEWAELPAALILLMVVAPSLIATTVWGDWINGITICLVIAAYLLQQHIRASGGFRNAFTQPHGVSNTVGIICLFIYPVWALVLDIL